MPLPSPTPNEPDALFCAFVCDNNGLIVHDFREQLPASFSRSIESDSLIDFLETVRTHGTAQGFEMRIRYGESTRQLQLHGCPTPYGTLVLATLMTRTVQDARSAASVSLIDSITKRKLMKSGPQEVAEDRAAEEHKEDNAKQLLNTIHTLQNSLSSVINSCEYLAEYSKDGLSAEQVEMIAGIDLKARTLLDLSDTIAELSNLILRFATNHSVGC